ncbi:hypothetical protein D3C80_1907050 [compost metagenome]
MDNIVQVAFLFVHTPGLSQGEKIIDNTVGSVQLIHNNAIVVIKGRGALLLH